MLVMLESLWRFLTLVTATGFEATCCDPGGKDTLFVHCYMGKFFPVMVVCDHIPVMVYVYICRFHQMLFGRKDLFSASFCIFSSCKWRLHLCQATAVSTVPYRTSRVLYT